MSIEDGSTHLTATSIVSTEADLFDRQPASLLPENNPPIYQYYHSLQVVPLNTGNHHGNLVAKVSGAKCDNLMAFLHLMTALACTTGTGTGNNVAGDA